MNRSHTVSDFENDASLIRAPENDGWGAQGRCGPAGGGARDGLRGLAVGENLSIWTVDHYDCECERLDRVLGRQVPDRNGLLA